MKKKSPPKTEETNQQISNLLAQLKASEETVQWYADRGVAADKAEEKRHQRMIQYMKQLESIVHDGFKIGGHE